MPRHRVRATLGINVCPEERVPGAAFEPQMRIDELGLTAFKPFIEVDQEGSDPLPRPQLFPKGWICGVQEVEVRTKFLPG